jgi:ADP-heptose:LPS heptosyltransferase
VVLCTPVIRWLHHQFPKAELHFVTKAAMAPVLQHHAHLSQLHILVDHQEKALLDELKTLKFDAIVDLHSNWRTLRWKFQLAPPGSGIPFLRFSKNNAQKWWMVQTKKKPTRYLHTVQKYAVMLQEWGITDDGLGLDWSFDPGLPAWESGESFLKRELGWNPSQGVCALALGSQHATKCLPKEKLIELCRLLHGPLLLLGGPQDKSLAEEIIASLDRKDIAHGCGRWNLQESAKALSECASLITPDTGLMHIGAALGIKLFVIWGNTLPEFGMAPWLPRLGKHPLPEQFEVDVSCRPCSKLGYERCPRGHFNCMTRQNIPRIALAVSSYLQSNVPGLPHFQP